MGFRTLLVLWAGCAAVSSVSAGALTLPDATFDRGGLTFDLEANSKRIYGEDGKVHDYRAQLSVCLGFGSNLWVEALAPYPIVITARPMGFLDRRFAVSEGQCGALQFGWKRRKEFQIKNSGDIGFELEVPSGYRVLGTTFGDLASVKSEPRPDGGTTMRMRAMDGLRPGEMMNSYRTLGVLVAPERGAREGRFSIVATETKSGKRLSPKESIVLYTVPPIRAKAVPKRYLNGLDTSVQHWFRSAEAYRPLVRLWYDLGVRWVLQKCEANDFIPYWREKPDTVVTPYWEYGLENGFRIGNGANRPAGDRFVFDPEHPKIKGREWFTAYLTGSTCPMAIYEERPYFLESIVPDLAARLKGANGMWANWEPSQFERKGCYCDNCKREFAKFAKLPQEEVDATWPKGFEEGEKWYAIGRKFRSWQHGLMIKTLNRHITRLTGGEKSMGFIPGVAWVEMTDRWITKDYPGEVKAVDYADELKWINPWGPYAYWFAPKPFRYRKFVPLNYWVAAFEIAGRVQLDYRDGHRPLLMAYPCGFQCGSYVTTPEHLKMAMDSFLFNRWHACCPYYFPNGYDARYLKAYVEAVELSAHVEDFVRDGRPANDRVTVTPVKEYALPAKGVSGWVAAYTNVAVLNTAAFDLKGARLVAALNFWDKAPAFFDLKNRALPSGDYTVTSGDVLYVKDRAHPFWTAEELAAGLRLAVGATRTAVFEIHPKAAGKLAAAKRVMTVAAMDGLYMRMRPELEAAAEADRLHERDAPREPWNSRMN